MKTKRCPVLFFCVCLCFCFASPFRAAGADDDYIHICELHRLFAVVDRSAFRDESAMLLPRNYTAGDLIEEICEVRSSEDSFTLEVIVKEPVSSNAFRLLEELRQDARVFSVKFDDAECGEGVYSVDEPMSVRELREITGMTVMYSIGAPAVDGNVKTGMLVRKKSADGLSDGDALSALVLRGDVNCDGAISAFDARLILRAAARIFDAQGCLRLAADADGSGAVTSADARLALRKAAHIDTKTTVGLDGMTEYRAGAAVMRQVPLRELDLEKLFWGAYGSDAYAPHILSQFLPPVDRSVPAVMLRGNVESLQGFEIEWDDENGRHFGPMPVTMMNISPIAVYGGSLPEQQTLRVLLPEPLWAGLGYHLLPGEEYVFAFCVPMGEEYKTAALTYGTALDTVELLSLSADAVCPTPEETFFPVVDERLPIGEIWFRNSGVAVPDEKLGGEDLARFRRFLYEDLLSSEAPENGAYAQIYVMTLADLEREADCFRTVLGSEALWQIWLM